MERIMNKPYRLFFLMFAFAIVSLPLVLYSADESAAGAGKVVLATGQLTARAGDGTERRLKRMDPVFAGDTVVVGENAFAQIRFSDGGLVALRSGTEFRVDEYRYDGKEDGSEKAVFSLLKGGLRTISGKIGKQHKDNYEMKTPVATIGIRGTHYGVRLCLGDCGEGVADGWYIGVLKGAIAFTINGKEYLCKAGEYYFIPLGGGEPRNLPRPSGIVFDGAGEGGETGGSDNPFGRGPDGEEPPFTAPREPGGGSPTSIDMVVPGNSINSGQ